MLGELTTASLEMLKVVYTKILKNKAADEISHWPEYEYVLVNRDMDQCLSQVRAIVAAERLKRTRRIGLVTFVRDLIGPQH